jgi:heat shock protein HslJ
VYDQFNSDTASCERPYVRRRITGEVIFMLLFRLLASALVAGIVLSCEAAPDGASQATPGPLDLPDNVAPPLEGTLWEFIEVEGALVVHFDNEEVPQIRLVAADHTIVAWLSCNLFKGTYEIEGESLRLHPIPVSWRDCLASHEQEDTIRRVIQAVTSYRIDDDRLFLFAEGRVVAVLGPMEQP